LCALSGDGLRMPKRVAVNEEYFVMHSVLCRCWLCNRKQSYHLVD